MPTPEKNATIQAGRLLVMRSHGSRPRSIYLHCEVSIRARRDRFAGLSSHFTLIYDRAGSVKVRSEPVANRSTRIAARPYESAVIASRIRRQTRSKSGKSSI